MAKIAAARRKRRRCTRLPPARPVAPQLQPAYSERQLCAPWTAVPATTRTRSSSPPRRPIHLQSQRRRQKSRREAAARRESERREARSRLAGGRIAGRVRACGRLAGRVSGAGAARGASRERNQLSRVLLVRWSRSGRGRRTRTRTASPTPAPTPAPVPVRARSGSNSARRSRCFTGAEAPSTMICYLPELCAVVIVCSWVRRRDVFGRRRSGDVCSGGGRGGGGGGGGGSGG